MHIIHTSIPVRDPKRVALALARLCDGAVYKFLHPGCYFVTLGEPGALIELYRKEIELRPGPPGEECLLVDVAAPQRYTGSHTALRVSCSADQVMQVATEHGWRAEVHRRKIFRVIEFWIENEYLLEVFPPDFAAEYLKACGMLGQVPPERG
jgi:hypothetical protein